jgi:hypothetical protein
VGMSTPLFPQQLDHVFHLPEYDLNKGQSRNLWATLGVGPLVSSFLGLASLCETTSFMVVTWYTFSSQALALS